VLSHSTALGGDVVSPINPRAILIGGGSVLAFNRGAQQVEIASNARDRAALNFYLVTFRQACNDAPGGCKSGDLYTPRIESDWQAVTVRDAEDLKNTPSDCRQCHQRGTREPLLLMREVDGPWTHFFGPDVDDHTSFPEATGGDLVRDYLSAKGDEPYASVPVRVLRGTIGFTLEEVVTFAQPVVFDGAVIENERWPWNGSGYPSEAQPSASWYAAYESFKRGEQLPLPYYAPRPTDPGKQAMLTAAYQSFLHGEIDAADLPDFSDIFPDDSVTRAEIGFQTEPGASAVQALVQACGTCHNDVLDQTVSRARFNVAIGRLDRAELDTAIERLEAPQGTPGRMPPSGRRQLDADGLSRLLDYLKRNERSSEDDAFLEHAATVGMVLARLR
jgi:cytochrome c553